MNKKIIVLILVSIFLVSIIGGCVQIDNENDSEDEAGSQGLEIENNKDLADEMDKLVEGALK